jgi:PAS domain S-box-containing protein
MKGDFPMNSYHNLLLSSCFLLSFPFYAFAMESLRQEEKQQEEKTQAVPVTFFSHKRSADEASEEREPEQTFPQTEGSPSKAKWGVTDDEVEKAFEKSKYLVSIMEFGGRFKRINKNWEETLGWTKEELMSAPYYEFIHPEDMEKTLAYEKQFIPTGFVNRWRHKDGSYRWLNWIGLSNFDLSEGHLPFSLAIDVSFDELLKEEAKQQVRILNENLQFQNRIIQAVINIQRLYLGELGHYGDEKNPEISFSNIIQHLVRLSESEFGFIASILKEDEKTTVHHKTWEANPTLDSQGQKLFEDCKAEKEGFSHLKGFLDELLRTKEIIIKTKTREAIETTGTSESSLIFHSFLGVPLISRNELVGILALVNRPSGYNQQLIEWFEPLFLLGGRIVNEVNLLHFRKKAEIERLERQKAEARSEAKSSFLAHMSHEIRTPLTGLLGTLELINQEKLHEEDKDYLKTAHGSGLALLSILNDILDISKIEAGQLKIEFVPFNPLSIAQEVFHLLSLEAGKKDLELKLISSPDIPPILVGDPTRLRQIFFNLISNAIKFTCKGSVLVSLDGKYEDRHFKFCGEVKDTGIGIPHEVQEKLFSPFFQADDSIKRKFGGTGLGLSITKKLCELMGGSIGVISEADKGSIFTFTVQLERPKELNPLGGSSPVNLPVGLPSNIRILMAEDNAVSQKVLKQFLIKLGCKTANITAVWNGQEAVDAVTSNPYDIVLMDGQMPMMDGLEATQKIREKLNPEALPIVGVTAHALTDDRERFLKAGMNGYLTKPIQKQGLCMEILRCLSMKKEPQ